MTTTADHVSAPAAPWTMPSAPAVAAAAIAMDPSVALSEDDALSVLLAPDEDDDDDDDDASHAIVLPASSTASPSPSRSSAAHSLPRSPELSSTVRSADTRDREPMMRQDAAYETDASSYSSSWSVCSVGSRSPATVLSTAATPEEQAAEDEHQRLRAIRLGKRQRQRQRQRDELKYLGFHVLELEAELTRLLAHHTAFTQETLAAAHRLALLPAAPGESEPLALPNVWRYTATYERESLQTSIMENTRLRAQYECQLQIANGLKRLYEQQGHLAVRLLGWT